MRVRTDVAALPKAFDYLVPPEWTEEVVVGTRVRVVLHGRSVGGWVVEDDVTPPTGVELRPLKKWSGWGPPPPLVELADWAGWRWAGPTSFFLGAASPAQVVRALPVAPGRPTGGPKGAVPWPALQALAGQALRQPSPAVVRLPPTTDLIRLVGSALDDPQWAGRGGGVLVLVPSVGWAQRLCDRLVRRGYPATTDWAEARAGWPIVVGSRAGAWAPLPQLAGVLVLDAHDEAYREESSPTYSAVDVVVERARREGSPCLLVSPCPGVALSAGRPVSALPAAKEREGWSTIECVDRRGADPRSGLFSEELVRLSRAVLDEPGLLERLGPLVFFYDRTGRARLLACAHCGELAQCTVCGAAVAQSDGGLRCPRCGQERPSVCAACGRLRMKTLRAGVTRLREEVAALLGTEVGEVTSASGADPVPDAPVLMGTSAVLHRVRRAAAVVFLDIDLHLLAPRFNATDESLALLVRACRLVGPRHSGAPTSRVLVQTRVPDHPVLRAVVRGDPSEVLPGEEAMRHAAGLPPFSALAAVSGPRGDEYADALARAAAGSAVTLALLPDGRHLVRAPDQTQLCDLLAAVPRPAGRGLRVEVDPVDL